MINDCVEQSIIGRIPSILSIGGRIHCSSYSQEVFKALNMSNRYYCKSNKIQRKQKKKVSTLGKGKNPAENVFLFQTKSKGSLMACSFILLWVFLHKCTFVSALEWIIFKVTFCNIYKNWHCLAWLGNVRHVALHFINIWLIYQAKCWVWS